MRKNVFFKLFVILLLLAGIFGVASGQRIKATAILDSTKILIGDQVKLRLELENPDGARVAFPQIPDSLAGKIEVIKKSAIDTTRIKDKSLKLVQELLITCFDSGVYRIPPFRFDINQPERNDSVFTNWLMLNVMTFKIDTSRGPADIKLPYDAPLTLKEVTPYMLGIILIGAILFLLLYSIKRKKKNLPLFVKPAKPKEPAHIIALRELDRIKEEKLWQKDKIKAYYSEVTEVLREYIEDRFEIPAMEQTSGEILTSFDARSNLISDKTLNHLERILPLADLVKFAKYTPLPDDHSIVLANAYLFVNETKIEEVKKPENTVEEQKNSDQQEETPKTEQ
jgi:hypothetical protein